MSDLAKERLLGDLAVINEALERHGAVPDVTVGEANHIDNVAALRTIVEASSHRLAALIRLQM